MPGRDVHRLFEGGDVILARVFLLPVRLVLWLPRLVHRVFDGDLLVPTTSSEAAQARSKQGRAGQQSVGRRHAPRGSRSARGPALVAALIVAVLVGAVGAMAYWTAPGAGSGAAKAGRLNPPTGVTVPRTTPLGPCRSAGRIGGRRRWGDSGGLLRRAERRMSLLVSSLRFGLDDESDHHRLELRRHRTVVRHLHLPGLGGVPQLDRF